MPVIDHLELAVEDLTVAEAFWCGPLGFWETDRSTAPGEGEMVFLTSDPATHHQVVLRQAADAGSLAGVIDHVAFRVASLDELRTRLRTATAAATHVETVSHGSTWSLYVSAPKGGRVEIYVDTPWTIAQPCRFDVDLSEDDTTLHESTRRRLIELGELV
ncbi:MAG: VOC family protein [Actinomycetota bacterium]